MTNIKTQLEQIITSEFLPNFYSVSDESHLHHGQKGLESHFRIEIISDHFLGLNMLKRHRLVQEKISSQLSKIKAFSLHTFTKDEWEKNQNTFSKSPTCHGG